MTQKPIHRAALKAMRNAQAAGWHTQSLICDTATQALIAKGYSEKEASAAVQVMWAENFAMHPPV